MLVVGWGLTALSAQIGHIVQQRKLKFVKNVNVRYLLLVGSIPITKQNWREVVVLIPASSADPFCI